MKKKKKAIEKYLNLNIKNELKGVVWGGFEGGYKTN